MAEETTQLAEQPQTLEGFTPSPTDVFSATNIKQAAVAPAGLPDLTDPLGLRTGLETKLGLADLRSAEQAILEEQITARGKARAQQAALKQLPRESLGFIGTARSRAAEESAIQEQAIAERLGVAQTARIAGEQQLNIQFDILNRERDRALNLAFQFPGAGISVNDSPSTIQGKLKTFQEDEEDRIREQSKKDAFDELFFKSFGKDRGKLSRNEARKKLRKEFKSTKAMERRMDDLSLRTAEAQLAKLRESLGGDDEVDIASLFGDATSTSPTTAAPDIFNVESGFNFFGI